MPRKLMSVKEHHLMNRQDFTFLISINIHQAEPQNCIIIVKSIPIYVKDGVNRCLDKVMDTRLRLHVSKSVCTCTCH